MTTRNSIVLSGDPKGHFIEVTLYLGKLLKPGTCIHLRSDGTYDDVVGLSSNGDRDEVIVLMEDIFNGKTIDDAYADASATVGGHFQAYIPVAGDELLVMFGNQSGTADDVAAGDLMMILQANGKILTQTGTTQMNPFKAMDAIVDPTADSLLRVRCTGH